MTEIKDQFEAACKILNIEPTALPVVDHLPEDEQKPIIAHYKLMKVIAAKNKINNDWKPDWNDRSQGKYYPWLWVTQKEGQAGFGLSCSDYDYSSTCASIGSRLCVGSAEDAKAVFEQNKDLYEAYFLP